MTPAAVLILIGYQKPESGSSEPLQPSLLFIRRTETVETHKGQMAFPGGLCSPEDQGNPIQTALRETEEEVGIPEEQVQLMGKLPPLVTTTSFSIQPVVGILKSPLEEVPLKLNVAETEEAIWIPLQKLFHPDTYRKEYLSVGSFQHAIDVYQVNQHRIWGATGSMTKNLLDRLSAVAHF